MGRKNPPQVSKTSGPAVSAKAPAMKYAEASKLADKNSRTIAKLEKLAELINSPGYQAGDPNRIIERYADKLKRRINRRLTKLARWSDSSAEERQAEFRRFFPSSSYNAYRPGNSFVPAPARPAPQPQHVLPPAPVQATQPQSLPQIAPSSSLPAPPVQAPASATVKEEIAASDPVAIVEQKVVEATSQAAVVAPTVIEAAPEAVVPPEAEVPIASEANDEDEEADGDNTDDTPAEATL